MIFSAGLAFAAGLLRAGGAMRVSGLVLMTSGWTFLMSQKGATETAARRNAMASKRPFRCTQRRNLLAKADGFRLLRTEADVGTWPRSGHLVSALPQAIAFSLYAWFSANRLVCHQRPSRAGVVGRLRRDPDAALLHFERVGRHAVQPTHSLGDRGASCRRVRCWLGVLGARVPSAIEEC